MCFRFVIKKLLEETVVSTENMPLKINDEMNTSMLLSQKNWEWEKKMYSDFKRYPIIKGTTSLSKVLCGGQ